MTTTAPASPSSLRARFGYCTPFRVPAWLWAVLVPVWLLLDAGDTWTTVVGVSSGVAEEGNPVAAAAFGHVGLLAGNLLMGVVFVAVNIALLWAGSRTRLRALRNGMLAGLVVITVMKAVVVASNTLVLTGAGGLFD